MKVDRNDRREQTESVQKKKKLKQPEGNFFPSSYFVNLVRVMYVLENSKRNAERNNAER